MIFDTSSNLGGNENSIIAMVALEKYAIPDIDSLFKLFTELSPQGLNLSDIQEKDGNIIFNIDNEIAFISFIPAPIPWNDLEGPCLTAWYWPEATDVMKKHQAHVLISIMPKNPDKSILERVISITQLTASVAKAANALGIYWGSGTLVQSTEYFISECLELNPDYLPLDLWIDFRVEQYPGEKCNIITTGMDAFGHMEIEIVESSKPAFDSFEFAFNVGNYLLINGPIINDGDTIGEDEQRKIMVKYNKSVWDRPNQVMNVLL